MTCRYLPNIMSSGIAEPHGAPSPGADRAADQRKVQNQEGPA
jgi:hypothetical protein